MGIIQRQTIKSTVYIYAGVLVGFITTGVVYPRVLSPNQIGAIILLASWASVFAQFATLGFNGATIKFFPAFRDKEQNHHGFLFIILLVNALGLLIYLGLFFGILPWLRESNDDSAIFQDKILWIIPFTLFQTLFISLDAYNRVLYNSTTGTLLKELILRLMILGLVALFFYQLLSFDGFVRWYIWAQGILTGLMIGFLIWKKEFNPTPDFRLLTKPMIKGLASLSLFNFLTGFSAMAIMRIDSIMIGSYLSETEVGIYTITLYFSTLILLPSRALRGIAPTLVADALEQRDFETAESIYRKSTISQLVVGIYLLLGLWTNTNTVFTILPEEYKAGLYVILFIGLANVVRMAGGLSDIVIGYSEYYKLNTVFTAGWLILIVLTNAIFIPAFGITGAALASLISMIAVTVTRYVFLLRKYRMQPYDRRHGWAIALALITYAIVSLLPTLQPFILDLLVRGTVVTLLFGGSIYGLRVSPEINQLIDTAVSRIRSLLERRS